MKVTVQRPSTVWNIPCTGEVTDQLSTAFWLRPQPVALLHAKKPSNKKAGIYGQPHLHIVQMPTLNCITIKKVCQVEDWVSRLKSARVNQKTVLKPRNVFTVVDASLMARIIQERARKRTLAWQPRREFTGAKHSKWLGKCSRYDQGERRHEINKGYLPC